MEGKIPSSPRVWIFIIQVKHAKLTVPPGDLLKQKRLTFMGIFRRASCLVWASQVTLVVRNQPTSAGDIRDTGSIPGSRRVPGGGNGNPLQYSCLENPMDREAWRAIVHGITESWTRLKWTGMHAHKLGLVLCHLHLEILTFSKESWTFILSLALQIKELVLKTQACDPMLGCETWWEDCWDTGWGVVILSS